jgi:hypothetical protein
MLRLILLKGEKAKKILWIYFTIQIFIIPNIFFYLETSKDWNKANDGQYFFGIYEVFPISSMAFITIGVIIDVAKYVKNRSEKNNTST